MSAAEIVLHLPAVVREGWEAIAPDPMRQLFIEQNPQPLIIGASFETPALPSDGGALGKFKRTALVARALLETIHGKPELKRCLVRGVYTQTFGETIAVTGRDREDQQTLIATLDYGESTLQLMKRFATMRRILKLPPVVARTFLDRAIDPNLPPPQVVLSNVSHLLDNPEMCLGACAGGSPIAINIGRKTSHVVLDHRLYDPLHEAMLINGLCENVRRMVNGCDEQESQA